MPFLIVCNHHGRVRLSASVDSLLFFRTNVHWHFKSKLKVILYIFVLAQLGSLGAKAAKSVRSGIGPNVVPA